MFRTGDAIQSGGVHESSLIQMQISGADYGEMQRQFDEAEAFLYKHGRHLRDFCRKPCIDEVYVDFGLCFPEDCVAFSRTVPLKLIRIAAYCNAAIELSFYPVRREAK